MKKILLNLALVMGGLLSFTSVNAEPATTQSVKNLMEITGAAKLGVKMIDQMLPVLKKAAPNASESFWNEFRAEIDPTTLQDLVIPIYQKHLRKQIYKLLIIFN